MKMPDDLPARAALFNTLFTLFTRRACVTLVAKGRYTIKAANVADVVLEENTEQHGGGGQIALAHRAHPYVCSASLKREALDRGREIHEHELG